MLFLVVLAFVVAVGFLTVSSASRRGTPRRSLFVTAFRGGVGIALVRLVVFYSGLSLFNGYADGRQVLGYALLILNSLVELGLAAALSGARPGPPILVAALIGLTSVLLGFVWAWLRFQPRSPGAAF